MDETQRVAVGDAESLPGGSLQAGREDEGHQEWGESAGRGGVVGGLGDGDAFQRAFALVSLFLPVRLSTTYGRNEAVMVPAPGMQPMKPATNDDQLATAGGSPGILIRLDDVAAAGAAGNDELDRRDT